MTYVKDIEKNSLCQQMTIATQIFHGANCLTNLPTNYMITAWQLHEHCLTTAWLLPEDSLKTAQWEPNICQMTDGRQHKDNLMIAW